MLQQLYNLDEVDEPTKCEEQIIYSEADIYPEGLPDPDDIKQKKRKTIEEKYIFEECRNPVNTPIAKLKPEKKQGNNKGKKPYLGG